MPRSRRGSRRPPGKGMMRDEHARLLHRLRHVPGHHAAVPLPAVVRAEGPPAARGPCSRARVHPACGVRRACGQRPALARACSMRACGPPPCHLSPQRWWSWSRARLSRCCGAPLPVAPAMRCWRSASPRAQCKAGHSRIAGWAPVSLCGAFPLSDGVSFLVGRAPTSAVSVGRFDGKIEGVRMNLQID